MRSIWRTILVYAFGVAAVWVIVPFGLRYAQRALRQERREAGAELRAERVRILEAHEIDAATAPQGEAAWQEWKRDLPAEVQAELDAAAEAEPVAGLRWMLIALVVTVTVVGVVGFCCAYASGEWILIGVIPALNAFVESPIVKMRIVEGRGAVRANLTITIAAFVVCYLLAYIAAGMSRRRDARRYRR